MAAPKSLAKAVREVRGTRPSMRCCWGDAPRHLLLDLCAACRRLSVAKCAALISLAYTERMDDVLTCRSLVGGALLEQWSKCRADVMVSGERRDHTAWPRAPLNAAPRPRTPQHIYELPFVATWCHLSVSRDHFAVSARAHPYASVPPYVCSRTCYRKVLLSALAALTVCSGTFECTAIEEHLLE